MIAITQAHTPADFQQIADLATVIWTDHYVPIVGVGQIVYMLEKFQSASAIVQQVQEGTAYFILRHGDDSAGYFSYYPKGESLFLSKLYVLSAFRGQGLAKMAIASIAAAAAALECRRITLTVNKNNTGSIQAYEKMGFTKVEAIVLDIGQGYVMDDYLMEKRLPPRAD
ncbi:MAG: GNAT family N-acetyltransferase [Bacteroidetes bacterium]|nr:MAG: GNAT family N-acetyltransferase [Bacteroidota bacterium]PTM14782.1 MAG: GNAT family N-acetyltransferase [Bacteroidota bacterium]